MTAKEISDHQTKYEKNHLLVMEWDPSLEHVVFRAISSCYTCLRVPVVCVKQYGGQKKIELYVHKLFDDANVRSFLAGWVEGYKACL